jgi:hypothetical protein
MDEITREYRGALRLLFILARAGDVPAADVTVPDAVRVITSEKKFQKMDFWIRNPDHLAYALMQAHMDNPSLGYLQAAQSIADSEEPEIRRDAMLKFLYGAFEPLDTSLAPLFTYGLATMVRDQNNKRARTYFLLPKGLERAIQIEAELPEAMWYSERATLVGSLCRGFSGDQLARWQYQHPSYSTAKNGETIKSIAAEVRHLLASAEATHE